MIESSLQRFLITFTVITASILELIDTTIVNVSLPVIGGELGATLSELSWVVAGYALANAVVVPITGWLGGYNFQWAWASAVCAAAAITDGATQQAV